jgi:hypothetical protein
VLDVPDAATRDAAIADRVAAAGGSERYAARYRGLDHRFYHREWMAQRFSDLGLVDIRVTSQQIAGYRNGRYRFNVFGWVLRRSEDLR